MLFSLERFSRYKQIEFFLLQKARGCPFVALSLDFMEVALRGNKSKESLHTGINKPLDWEKGKKFL